MSISEPFIRRPVATTLLMIGIALAGFVGYSQLPVAALPQVDYPTIVVSTTLPGASAGFDLLYVGGAGSVRGKSADAALIAACTSCSAASMLRSRSNCNVICELPWLEIDVICVSDGT